MMRSARAIAPVVLQLLPIRVAAASEYLGNNQRTGYFDAAVPRKPVLLWTYQERHAPRNAWPEPFGELQFIDFGYSDQVTIGEGKVAFGSSADHTVRALDADSGDERWVLLPHGSGYGGVEVSGIHPCTTIEVSLKSVSGKPPLICALEIIAE